MKPKTKKQREIVSYLPLPPLSDKEKEFIIKKFPKNHISHYNKCMCLECGHYDKTTRFKNETICPKCGAKTTSIFPNVYFSGITLVYGKFNIVNGYQVLRLFYVKKKFSKRNKPDYIFLEAINHWLDKDYKHYFLSLKTNDYYYIDSWSYNSKLEFRKKSLYNERRKLITANYVSPYSRIRKDLKLRGYKPKFAEYSFTKIISNIHIPYVETLLKKEYISLLDTLLLSNKNFLTDFWKTIRLALRYNYRAKNWGMWIDYIILLNEIGRDILNPKYIFPEDIEKEHDRILEIKAEKDRKKERKEVMKIIDKLEREYAEHIAPVIDIEVSIDDLTIFVIPSVKMMKDISDFLHNCAFDSKYYSRDTYLFVAVKNNYYFEMIEVDNETFEVYQSLGYKNKRTKYTKRIIKELPHLLTQKMQKHEKTGRNQGIQQTVAIC